MSLLDHELLIQGVGDGMLDIQPRGQGCYTGFATPTPDHDFFLTTQAAGYTYKICGRCGTVRIAERR
jgi:hypothetical protein